MFSNHNETAFYRSKTKFYNLYFGEAGRKDKIMLERETRDEEEQAFVLVSVLK